MRGQKYVVLRFLQLPSLPPLPPDTAKELNSPCFFFPISSWSAATASCSSASNRISTPHLPHAPCVRSTIPGEPVPSSEFLAKVRNGQVPFEPFRVPGVWGTTMGHHMVRGERPHRHGGGQRTKSRTHGRPRLARSPRPRIPIRGTCLSCRRHRHQIREPTQPLDSTRLRGRQQHCRTR